MEHLVYILFLFAIGACVGSFLNVVVYRVPLDISLISPPSHCPQCKTPLPWYDNIPVFGWIKLGGKCRFCREPISARYPIVEAITGLLFAGYYWAFFVEQIGPCHVRGLLFINDYWWLYGLDMVLISGLLAASLIDAELFIIPLEIPWLIAPLAVVVHAMFDYPGCPGRLVTEPVPAALATGAVIGLAISLILKHRGIFKKSFDEDAPMTDAERKEHATLLREERKKAVKDSAKSEAKAEDDEKGHQGRRWFP